MDGHRSRGGSSRRAVGGPQGSLGAEGLTACCHRSTKTDVMALVILVLLGLVVIGAFFAFLVWWLVDRDSHRHGRD